METANTSVPHACRPPRTTSHSRPMEYAYQGVALSAVSGLFVTSFTVVLMLGIQTRQRLRQKRKDDLRNTILNDTSILSSEDVQGKSSGANNLNISQSFSNMDLNHFLQHFRSTRSAEAKQGEHHNHQSQNGGIYDQEHEVFKRCEAPKEAANSLTTYDLIQSLNGTPQEKRKGAIRHTSDRHNGNGHVHFSSSVGEHENRHDTVLKHQKSTTSILLSNSTFRRKLSMKRTDTQMSFQSAKWHKGSTWHTSQSPPTSMVQLGVTAISKVPNPKKKSLAPKWKSLAPKHHRPAQINSPTPHL